MKFLCISKIYNFFFVTQFTSEWTRVRIKLTQTVQQYTCAQKQIIFKKIKLIKAKPGFIHFYITHRDQILTVYNFLETFFYDFEYEMKSI